MSTTLYRKDYYAEIPEPTNPFILKISAFIGILCLVLLIAAFEVQAVGTYPAPNANTVLYYHFNNDSNFGESQTFFYDYSASGRNGTGINTTINLASSYIGDGSVNFSDSSVVHYINASTPVIPLTNQITVMAWVRPQSFGAARQVVSRWVSSTNRTELTLGTGNQVFFTVANGTTSKDGVSTATITTPGWHFIAGTYDGQNLMVYVDGVRSGANVSQNGNIPNSGELFIGARSNKLLPMNGSIDDVIIYNRTLTDQEIKDIYNGYVNSCTPILNQLWNISDAQTCNSTSGSPLLGTGGIYISDGGSLTVNNVNVRGTGFSVGTQGNVLNILRGTLRVGVS